MDRDRLYAATEKLILMVHEGKRKKQTLEHLVMAVSILISPPWNESISLELFGLEDAE